MPAKSDDWKKAWAPSRDLEIDEYIEKHVALTQSYAIPGPVNLQKSRYLIKPLRALTRPWVRTITILKAVQTGGSLVTDLFLTWMPRIWPAPTMVNMQTDPDSKDHAQMRINPLMEQTRNVAVLFPAGRHHKMTTEILFQLMWLLIQGANRSNLQSKSTCNVINDEIAFWIDQAFHRDAVARTTAFGWQKKIVNISQAGLVGDVMDRFYLAGSREDWGFECPKCQLRQPFKWQYEDAKAKGGMKWEKNDLTYPDGVWNWDELQKTVAYECRGCGHRIPDKPRDREALDATGDYIAGNPRAAYTDISLHIPAMASTEIRWIDLVREWLEAIDSYKQGNIEPLIRFIQKRLAESFGDAYSLFEVQVTSNRDYKLGDLWPDEIARVMTVDKQKDHYWYVVRAWAADGRSRLIECGRPLSEDEIHEIALRLNVPPENVGMDSGNWASEVHQFCCIFGWRALKGDERKAFPWVESLPGEPRRIVYKPFSPARRIDPTIGYTTAKRADVRVREFEKKRQFEHAIEMSWSNPWIKDFLQRLKSGTGLYWGIAADVPKVYLDHLEGEKKIRKINRRTGEEEWVWVRVGTKGDHLLDCERMNLVYAIGLGFLGGNWNSEPADPKEVEVAAA